MRESKGACGGEANLFSNYRSDRIACVVGWSAAPEVCATLTGPHGLLAHLELVGRLLSAELGVTWV